MTPEECGVRFLTGGAVQQWREAPSMWALGALFGIKDYKVPAVARSIAVKDGLRVAMHYNSPRLGEDAAIALYARKLVEWGIDPDDPGARSEEDTVLPLFDCLVQKIQQAGFLKKPLAFNIANSLMVDGTDIPLLSVADFVFEHTQLKVKTGKQLPSKIRPREMASLAIDFAVRAKVPMVAYATIKKAEIYAPTYEELIDALDSVVHEARAIETLILSSGSREHMLAMLPINPGHFMWRPGLLSKALTIINQARRQDLGTLCTEAGRIRESTSGVAHGDMLPSAGSWDAEDEL